MVKNERRRAVRAPARLAMEVQLARGDLARGETINVSANGVYFTSTVHIPVMTRLAITLALPEVDDPKRTASEVNCQGVVVRTEPEEPEPGRENYQVACYFTSISAEDKDNLEAYILGQLAF